VEGLVDRARRRRSDWPSRREAREWFTERDLFGRWDDRALDLYVLDGLRDRPDGTVELKCAGAVEAEVFARGAEVDVAAWAPTVAVPTLATMPCARIEDVDAGHFVPMERPALVAEAALRSCGEAV
jgi:pimeloyl-ACP methyl ester carboxylesterase